MFPEKKVTFYCIKNSEFRKNDWRKGRLYFRQLQIGDNVRMWQTRLENEVTFTAKAIES